jgi:hypothetical protein
MTKLRWTLALSVLAASLVALPGQAADHLVVPAEIEARLAAAAQARHADLASVERFLQSPAAQRAARSLGQDPRDVSRSLQVLSDEELRDLAARAEALGQDPVAGLSSDVNQLLIIFLIVAIVILVLQAVD